MKKYFKLFLALVLAIFTLPFSGLSVKADAKVYDNIKDGEYHIIAKAINKDTGEKSGAANFLSENATLNVHNGEMELTITVPHNPMAEITGMQIEGIEPSITEGNNASYYTYKLKRLTSELAAQVQYEVPSIGMKHDTGFKFVLEGLDGLPVVEDDNAETPGESEDTGNPETPGETVDTENPENPGNAGDNGGTSGEDASENNDSKSDNENGNIDPALIPDKAYTINFVSESPSTNRQFNNPAALLYKNGKTYIQMSGKNGHFIKSLTINGKEVTWGKKNPDGSFTIQFEITGSLSDKLDFGMVIDTGRPDLGIMDHKVKLSFDETTKQAVHANEYTLLPIDNSSEKPNDDKDNDPGKTEKPSAPGNNGSGNTGGTNKGSNNGGKTGSVIERSQALVPDKAYTINYDIKKADGNGNSISNDFFVKPAFLFVKDGKKYVHLTITNGDMVKELRNQYGNALLIRENADGSIVVQLRVPNDLSDTVLSMHIVVPSMPGFPGYDMEHDAILVFYKDSMREIPVGGHLLGGTTELNNTNGPSVANSDEAAASSLGSDSPEKPEFGSNAVDLTSKTKTGKQTTNPKTGDTASMIVYLLLLIGSAIPLVMKLKKRLA